ncbi:hypothetical protein XELAEV_18040573mg [Xenopus laevis]|uniref:Uncharacterized protein n=1 Tax=Xenopus laevis TaxID=8355 RepID=A0A974C9Z0_XENLA|nr:hypothetical protein XELAEV_18040573mg [Xenopus laevis]
MPHKSKMALAQLLNFFSLLIRLVVINQSSVPWQLKNWESLHMSQLHTLLTISPLIRQNICTTAPSTALSQASDLAPVGDIEPSLTEIAYDAKHRNQELEDACAP